MSAFIVSDQHIAYLVNAALLIGRKQLSDLRYETPGDSGVRVVWWSTAESTGQMLLEENQLSVHYRYSDPVEEAEYTH